MGGAGSAPAMTWTEKKMFRMMLVFALALPAAAWAQIYPERIKLLTSARYAELEKYGENEIRDDPAPRSAKLMPLCAAYSKLKRYNKLFPCLDRLEANVKAGDIAMMDVEEMRRGSPLLMGLATLGAAFAGGDEALKGTVVPMLHLMRAEAYSELRDYDKAIAAAGESYKAIPERWNQERNFRIWALTALGLAHAFAGNRDEARKRAQELSETSTSYPYTLLTPEKWFGVGRIHAALGDFRSANEALRQDKGSAFGSLALAVGGAVAGLRQGESFTEWVELPKEFLLYKTQLEIGEVKEAKAGFDKLLSRANTRDNGEIYWLLLHDRGRIAAQEGDMTSAIDYWKRAIEVIEQQRSTINTEANKIGFVGDKQAVYRRLIAALFSTQNYAVAFDYLERSKSRALVDLLAGKKDFAVVSGNDDKVRSLLASVERAEVESRAQVPADPQLRSLVVAPVRDALREQAPELASLVSVSATPLAEIQERIPQDEALIEYYYDESALYAFLLTRSTLQGVRLDAADLEADIRELRRGIEEPKSETWLASARRLHAKLVSPLEPLLGRSRLIIVPHGALHYLPFAALHDGSGFLIQKYSLRLLPSASVIRYLRAARSAKPGGILAFGNPDLGDPKYDLHFAEEEARAIVQTVPQSRALVRKAASESALREFASGFNYLHFATHGEFNAEVPLKSALLLSREETGDGLLTVGKLYSIRLDADLVTLSACETGLGKIVNGDDVVGLTRGFLYAGASTIVASLWKVDDQATAELMNEFYRGLKPADAAAAAKDKREALRQAQLATRAKFPHPYYWAAFQLTGNAE